MSSVLDGSHKQTLFIHTFKAKGTHHYQISQLSDTRKVREATPEKNTKINILRAIPKKDNATFDLQPPPSVSLLSELPSGTKYFSRKRKQKGNDRHTHTYDNQLCHLLFWIENKCV